MVFRLHYKMSLKAPQNTHKQTHTLSNTDGWAEQVVVNKDEKMKTGLHFCQTPERNAHQLKLHVFLNEFIRHITSVSSRRHTNKTLLITL